MHEYELEARWDNSDRGKLKESKVFPAHAVMAYVGEQKYSSTCS
jgi:hypothetical protein